MQIHHRDLGLPGGSRGPEQRVQIAGSPDRIAGFPVEKRLDQFDFGFQPSIDRTVINEIATLKFVHNAENVVFLGPPGVGKTHLSIGIGIAAAQAGFRVHFANASALVEDLSKADGERKLEEKIRGLAKFQLLIVDEMGYLPFDDHGAHCFFQLISPAFRINGLNAH